MELQNQTVEETDQSPANTSGQGKKAVVPKEIKGWNWGAFLLTWIWGLSHRVLISLLIPISIMISTIAISLWGLYHITRVPFLLILSLVCFIIISMFVLGIKGNEWAWRAKHYDSIKGFKNRENKWSIIAILCLPIILFLIWFFLLGIGCSLDGPGACA